MFFQAVTFLIVINIWCDAMNVCSRSVLLLELFIKAITRQSDSKTTLFLWGKPYHSNSHNFIPNRIPHANFQEVHDGRLLSLWEISRVILMNASDFRVLYYAIEICLKIRYLNISSFQQRLVCTFDWAENVFSLFLFWLCIYIYKCRNAS